MDITAVVSDVLDNQDLDVNLVGDFLQMAQDYQNQLLNIKFFWEANDEYFDQSQIIHGVMLVPNLSDRKLTN